MSAPLPERIEDVTKKISETEARRRELLTSLAKDGIPTYSRPTTTERRYTDKWDEYHSLGESLLLLQQELTSLQLESLSESSQRLENLTANLGTSINTLNSSAKSQLEATKALRAYSRRLEVFTEALIVLTAILSVVGFSNYVFVVFRDQGYSVGDALYWTSIGDFALILLICIAFAYLILMGRRKKASEEAATPGQSA